MIAIFKFVAV